MRDLLVILGLVALLLLELFGPAIAGGQAHARDPDAAMLEEMADIREQGHATSTTAMLASVVEQLRELATPGQD